LAHPSSELIPEQKLTEMVKMFKAGAHPFRLQILNLLLKGECQVSEINESVGIRQSLASQLLSNLKFDGILKSRRDGNKTYYSYKNDSIKKIMEVIIAEI
jgi:ArsR family transcriptional regulator